MEDQFDTTIQEHHVLQTKEVADNVKELEAPLEGILLKSHQIAENTKPKDVQKVQIEGAELITIKGDKGDKGDEPTDDRLKELIKPLIPEPIKGDPGKTPTETELLELLLPYIPKPLKGEPGKTPTKKQLLELIKSVIDENKLVKKILSLLPEIKNGDPGRPGKNGSPDTPEQVKAKLLKAGIDWEEIQNVPDIQKMINIRHQASKTVDASEVTGLEDFILEVAPGGSGSSDNFADSEVPSGDVDGVNVTYGLAHTPIAGSLKVFVNGQRFKATVDYTLATATITMVTAPPATSIILVDYRY